VSEPTAQAGAESGAADTDVAAAVIKAASNRRVNVIERLRSKATLYRRGSA
jgi:hypothetical protein